MATRLGSAGVPIERIDVSAYKVPSDSPESDGTYERDSTTMVLVEAAGGGETGLGCSYADTATARLVRDLLAGVVRGRDAMAVPGTHAAMVAAVRNLDRPGIAAMAISAVDASLWDLKARLLDVALVTLLGAVRDEAPVYGSGGFTSYSPEQLRDQLGGWAAAGILRVKMKIGRHPEDDRRRVRIAREAIGPDAELFVDANGAYSRKQALAMAEEFAELGVTWFEEPVSSDDLDGLHLLRDRAAAGMDIAAGEYGYDLFYFRRMLDAGAVDVLQADGTRCGGITDYLRAGVLCESRAIPFSAHCAPSLHAHPSCALPAFRHLEFFHDHDRIEHLFFDGALSPIGGALRPDPGRPGFGLEFKRQDAARFAI
jgi:L-alanine-DL-glutamate epimerase-like enolase superfamily enzyme